MTKEERENAIRCLKMWIEREPQLQTYRTCLEALEQEPCEDCISREEAIRIASGYCHWANIPDELAKLPSVTPKQKMGRWIPVSERLPKKSGNYWCTFGGTYLTGTDSYTTKEDAERLFGDTADEDNDESLSEYIGWNSKNVIAWMPLPEPYESEEKSMDEIDFIQPKKTVGKLISVDVLDKIRAEIDKLPSYVARFNGGDFAIHIDKEKVLDIIDKYKTEIDPHESEVKE